MTISEITAYFEEMCNILNYNLFEGSLPPFCVVISGASNNLSTTYSRQDVWSKNGVGLREIVLSSEILNLNIYDAVVVLIHEMIHHYCYSRGLKDTSRGNTYHNKIFRQEAEKRFLIVEYSNKTGFTILKPSEKLKKIIDTLGFQENWNGVKTVKPIAKNRDNGIRKYVCPSCGNSVRATKDVNIACLDCNKKMVIEKRM